MLLATMSNISVTRTLALALRTIGSTERLAQYLGVSQDLLNEWLEGRREAPTLVYLRALDLVASGPFGSMSREDGGKKT